MVYNNINKVELSKTEFNRLRDFLKVDFENDSEEMQNLIDRIDAFKDDYIPVCVFAFENGDRISVRLCSGSSNYYDDCELWNKDDDRRDWTFDCGYEIDEDMQFEYDGNLYNCHITITD